MKYRLQNKTVVLTGATGGIGKELAALLVEKYACTVYGVGRNREKANGIAQELDGKAGKFIPLIADLSSSDAFAAFDGIQADLLILNAGILPPFTKAEKTTAETLRSVMEINFFSPVSLTQYLLPTLKNSKQGGVLFISSSDALCPIAGTSAYSASKTALRAYAETLISEEKELFVSVACPGFTQTELFTDVDFAGDKTMRKLSSSPQKTAKKILSNVKRGKRRFTTGADAYWMNVLYKLAPVKGPALIKRILQKSGRDAFKDL